MEQIFEEQNFSEDKLHEECGVFGIFSHNEDVALNTYWGLYALQHRGQESTGIVVTDGERMKIKKGMGLVADVFKDGVADLQGYAAIGHVRYSTTGASMPYNIQPLKVYFDGGNLALSHNGNLTNAGQLRTNLAKEGAVFNTTVDSEVVLNLIAYSARPTIEERVAEAVNQIKGAFAILLMTDNKIIAVRDPYGFRPLVLGKMENGWCVASESCAFDLVGAELVRDVKPGEMIIIDSDNSEPRSMMWAENNRQSLRTAFLNMFTLLVMTVSSTTSPYMMHVSRWDASWLRKRLIFIRISLYPFLTAVLRRQSAMLWRPVFPSWKVLPKTVM